MRVADVSLKGVYLRMKMIVEQDKACYRSLRLRGHVYQIRVQLLRLQATELQK